MLTITYYAPYQFANHVAAGRTIEEAKAAHAAWLLENGYCIANREIRSIFWNGKKVQS